jgi:hypothetical protein
MKPDEVRAMERAMTGEAVRFAGLLREGIEPLEAAREDATEWRRHRMAGFRRLGPRPTPIPELRTWVEWQLLGLSPTAACREEYIRESQRPSYPRKAKSTTPCTEGDDEGAREVELELRDEMEPVQQREPGDVGEMQRDQHERGRARKRKRQQNVRQGVSALRVLERRRGTPITASTQIRAAMAATPLSGTPERHQSRNQGPHAITPEAIVVTTEVWVELAGMKRRYKLPHKSTVRALCRMVYAAMAQDGDPGAKGSGLQLWRRGQGRPLQKNLTMGQAGVTEGETLTAVVEHQGAGDVGQDAADETVMGPPAPRPPRGAQAIGTWLLAAAAEPEEPALEGDGAPFEAFQQLIGAPIQGNDEVSEQLRNEEAERRHSSGTSSKSSNGNSSDYSASSSGNSSSCSSSTTKTCDYSSSTPWTSKHRSLGGRGVSSGGRDQWLE